MDWASHWRFARASGSTSSASLQGRISYCHAGYPEKDSAHTAKPAAICNDWRHPASRWERSDSAKGKVLVIDWPIVLNAFSVKSVRILMVAQGVEFQGFHSGSWQLFWCSSLAPALRKALA